MLALGLRMKAWREHRGLTQREAAKLVGVSQTFWSLCESGQRAPTSHRVVTALVRTTRHDGRFALRPSLFAGAAA